jgi:tRNA-uridine 2-sulfurtransferase
MSSAPRVFVGLSGGVDSSVAALRLKQRGFDVVGVFIKVWHPDWLVCNWEEERLDAMRVAAHLDIPFLTCDAEKEYRDDVAAYFIAEYQAGRTPNPDVMCNKYVKFGAFMRFAQDHNADYIATGHYARRVEGETGPELHRGIDPGKDQSYFLWTLTNEQLAYTLLPIGDTQKDTIRSEAAAHGIPTAQKKDSQGICFLGHIDIREFLSHYTHLEPGPVITETGERIGTHAGALLYTPGQRHGLTINTAEEKRPSYFVIRKDIEKNTVTVSTQKPILTQGNDFILTSTVFRSPLPTQSVIEAQTRYHQKPFSVSLTHQSDSTLTLTPLVETEAAAIGQSCVLYEGSHCLGGGIIT